VESLPSWLPPAKTGFTLLGVRGGVVCWGTALHAGRSRVWFPMVLLGEFLLA
jgi:hypothetical protein